VLNRHLDIETAVDYGVSSNISVHSVPGTERKKQNPGLGWGLRAFRPSWVAEGRAVAEEKCGPFEQYKHPYSAPTIIHKAPEAATIASDYWLLRPQFVSRADSTNPYAVLVCFHHSSS
jgi:hypothetical protein